MMQVERNVYTAWSACAHVTIKGLQYRLVRVEIVEAVSPDSIVSRNANEIESISIHEIESPFVCRPWPPDERALDFMNAYGFDFVRIPTDYRVWTDGFDYFH